MTRATAHPVRRVVTSQSGELVVEITDRTLAIRPIRSKRGGPAEVLLLWGSVYIRGIEVKIEEKKREQKRARRARSRGKK